MIPRTRDEEHVLFNKIEHRMAELRKTRPNLSVEGQIVFGDFDDADLDDQTETVPAVTELERAYANNRSCHLGPGKDFGSASEWGEDIGSPAAPLEKAAITGDLSKRSSGPGRVRIEKVEIDGEEWAFGYNHKGECVYSRDPDTLAALGRAS